MSNEHTTPPSAGNEPIRLKKRIPAIAVAVLMLLVLLIPCVLAAVSNTIYPRTSVAGIAVGGLSQSEAADLLARELPGAYEGQVLPITVEDTESDSKTFELPLSDIHITADADQAAQAAWDNGRSSNFFTRGVAYAKGLLLGHAVTPELQIDQAGAADAIAAIAAQADDPPTECTWYLSGDALHVTKPKDGRVIDQQALLETVEDALTRYDLGGITCSRELRPAAAITMEELYQDAYKEASSAYYDKASGTVKDGDTGVDFDVSAAQ